MTDQQETPTKRPNCSEEILSGSTSCDNCGATLAAEPASDGQEDNQAHAAATVVGSFVPFCLVVLTGPDKGKTVPLGEEEASIGRETDNTLVLLDPLVSRHHVTIRRKGENYEIEDLGSANGVYIDDTRISEPHVLREGDRVRVGDSELLFTQASAAAGVVDSGDPTITIQEETPKKPQAATHEVQSDYPIPPPPPPPVTPGSVEPGMADERTSPRPQPAVQTSERKDGGTGKWVALSCAGIVVLLLLLACLLLIVAPRVVQVQ